MDPFAMVPLHIGEVCCSKNKPQSFIGLKPQIFISRSCHPLTVSWQRGVAHRGDTGSRLVEEAAILDFVTDPPEEKRQVFWVILLW